MYCYYKFKHIIKLKSKYVLHETDIVPNLYFLKKLSNKLCTVYNEISG